VTEPWDDPRITAFGMLLEAHAAVLTHVGRDLEASSGIPVAWMEVLLRLARSPQQRLRMAELARQVGLSTSGLTRLIDRIEQAGYVGREACATDRRGAEAVLTAEGQEVLRASLPAHLESIETNLVAPLGDDVAELEELLRRVRDGIGPGECPADL
jgi:MarR family 2-MHQ and catechol resistance regulon transcriptional repressor